jgi:hypothetical protein
MNTDTQYNHLLNKAKEYSNSGFDSQIAIDRADEFWNDAYMS